VRFCFGFYVFITSISLVPGHGHSILRINFTVRDCDVHEDFIGPSRSRTSKPYCINTVEQLTAGCSRKWACAEIPGLL